MCHKKNIVHRDLKPENILFEGSSVESTVKVIDFGRSKLLTPTQKIMERAGSVIFFILTKSYFIWRRKYCSAKSITNNATYGVQVSFYTYCYQEHHPFTAKHERKQWNESQKETHSLKVVLMQTKNLEPAWRRISPEAKEFLKKLLRYVPEERPTASEALKDPWIRKYSSMKGAPQEELLVNLENLRSFRTQMTLQKAVLSYIASQELSKAEEEKLKEAFDSIDTDKNGRISKEELVEAYVVLHGNEGVAKIEAHRVMTRIDINQNGTIDYNEFLMANLAVQNALSEERLKKAFEFFDSVFIKEMGNINVEQGRSNNHGRVEKAFWHVLRRRYNKEANVGGGYGQGRENFFGRLHENDEAVYRYTHSQFKEEWCKVMFILREYINT
eukprot:TRINITY_DN4088_c0_g1_i1.p2 TRINITY_DN4088_c0_g1~~TRINITY_DN4088_c0_g1_i1.p2  ORF type:complete len:386 (-),score=40.33 TRINITY_DN4088_c0_g1_i1:3646-4803(-)